MDRTTIHAYYHDKRRPGWDMMVNILDAIGYDLSFHRKGQPKPNIFGDERERPEETDRLLRADDHLIGNRGPGAHWRDKQGIEE